MSLSNITVSGRLKEDPVKRVTPSNIPVTNLFLEITYIGRGYKNGELSCQTVRVNAWRDLANECEQNLKAGDRIIVSGKVQINAYTTSEGKKKKEVEIDANSVVRVKDILELETPASVSMPSQKESFTTVPSDSAEVTNDFNEVVSNQEEIPF